MYELLHIVFGIFPYMKGSLTLRTYYAKKFAKKIAAICTTFAKTSSNLLLHDINDCKPLFFQISDLSIRLCRLYVVYYNSFEEYASVYYLLYEIA